MAHCPPQSLPAGHPDIYPFHHQDTNYTFNGFDDVSVTYSVGHFLDHLCTYYGHIPISSLWVVQFKFDNPNFAASLAHTVGHYEPGGFETWAIPQNWSPPIYPNNSSNDNLQGLYGCLYAQKASVIGEETQSEKSKFGEQAGHAHYTPGTVLSGRQPPGNLQLSFIETNDSFVDHFLRPWQITASRLGLLARPANESIKADIKVIEFSVTNGGPPTRYQSSPRKTTIYRNAVPITVSSRELNYAPDNGPQTNDVTFAFNYYHILGGSNTNPRYGSPRPSSPSTGPGHIIGLAGGPAALSTDRGIESGLMKGINSVKDDLIAAYNLDWTWAGAARAGKEIVRGGGEMVVDGVKLLGELVSDNPYAISAPRPTSPPVAPDPFVPPPGAREFSIPGNPEVIEQPQEPQ